MKTEYLDLMSFKGGIAVKTTTANVHDTTPTAAQINAALAEGAAQEDVPFKLAIMNDASGETNVYLVCGNGTDTFWLKFTKGV